MLKEEAALLTMDDNSIAVQQVAVTGRTEGADFINVEKTPVRPENGAGLHITGGIKIGSDLDIETVRHRHPIFQFIIHNS